MGVLQSDKPWDIALLCSSAAECYGGAESYVLNLLPHLAERARVKLVAGVSLLPRLNPDYAAIAAGNRVGLARFRFVSRYSRWLRFVLSLRTPRRWGLKTYDVEALCGLLSLRHVWRQLAEAAVVEVNYPTEALLFPLLPPSVRKVMHLHGPALPSVLKATRGAVWRHVDAVVACSDWTRRTISELPPDVPVYVVHEGIDIGKFRPLAAPDLSKIPFDRPHNPDAFKVGMVARLSETKGLNVLLDVAQQWNSATPVEFFFVGPTSEPLETVRQRWAALTNVHFLGPVPNHDLVHFYNFIDCFALPSHQPESFGIVLTEAMACERLTVSSNLGGTNEIITHGEDGFLVPPTTDVLGRRLRELAEERYSPRLTALRRRARETVAARFDWERIAAKALEVFQAVIANGRQRL